MYRQYKKDQERNRDSSVRMGKLKIGLVLSSTREGRMCDRVANFVRAAVEKQHTAVIIDPLEIDFPQSQQSMNWFYNPSAVPDNIRALNDTVTSCDALIALTAEYNFSIPPAFANIVDNLPPSTFTWKPCAIVSYSLSTIGGWRAALQVRQMLGAVGCTLTQKQMGIPVVHEALEPDGKAKDDKLGTELATLLSQLVWLTTAINNQKQIEAPPQFSL